MEEEVTNESIIKDLQEKEYNKSKSKNKNK
jgi:hypothetical protein